MTKLDKIAIKKILKYLFDEIDWDYELLTKSEKRIIHDQNMLNRIRSAVDENR